MGLQVRFFNIEAKGKTTFLSKNITIWWMGPLKDEYSIRPRTNKSDARWTEDEGPGLPGMSTSGSSPPLCLRQYYAATFTNSVSPFFSFCLIELCYLGWLSADGQTLLASMENLMLYSEGKGTKISSFFIRYAFGVLYKTGDSYRWSVAWSRERQDRPAHFLFGFCRQLILTTIFLIICLLCPLSGRLVSRHVFQ